MKVRFLIVISVFILTYGFLLFKLYSVQILSNQNYLARAESQYAAAGLFKAERGGIFFTDKNNNTLSAVLNRDFPVIYSVPKAIDDVKEAAHTLAPILEISTAELEKKFSKKDDLYELLVKKAPKEIIEQVEELKLKGIHVNFETDRYYPFDFLMSHSLGFVGVGDSSESESGQYGLERFYEEILSGKVGQEKDGKITEGKKGSDINLSIDPNIQIEAQKILSALITNHNAKGGTIIVQEPQTGKILALESQPGFNPNSYGQFDFDSFLNPAIQAVYEPGSVFKVITMAAGIDSGRITPETSFYDSGVLKVSGRELRNWDLKSHGEVTMTNVIEQSINTGAAFAEKKTGHMLFKKYLEKFGFADKTNIDLPGELDGNISRLKSNAPEVAFATASFGQGVAVTPIEMINAFSAIANGGELMRPYLKLDNQPEVIRRVISEKAAKDVTEMMVSALDKAEIGRIKGYSLAGKTGTAQIPDFNKGGYTDQVINTYIGFGPTTNSKFVILIKLNSPKGAPLAGTTVVPAFRELAQFIITYYNIPPDRL